MSETGPNWSSMEAYDEAAEKLVKTEGVSYEMAHEMLGPMPGAGDDSLPPVVELLAELDVQTDRSDTGPDESQI